MKKIFLMSILFLLVTSLILAVPANPRNPNVNNNVSNPLVQDNQNIGNNVNNNLEAQTQNKALEQNLMEKRMERIMLREGNYTDVNGQRLQVRSIEGELKELRGNRTQIRTQLRIETETDEQNRTRLRVNFSNGKNAEIKIMPDVASQRALERLRLKNCNSTENCTIELKEVGNGNQTKVVYELQTRKETRILGLFKARMNVEAQVDAETGEVIQAKRPWWAFLSSN
ncbi:hypothetical protein GYA25_03200 [Candidatus Woesearchaeota archaeon]|jgi:hypothetical protein|nr:hypothetical protein [Candidatus Woesearchaeota archaeon]